MLEGFLHATIDGGTMLRIDANWHQGQCLDCRLELLTDNGWRWLYSISIRKAGPNYTVWTSTAKAPSPTSRPTPPSSTKVA